MPKEVKLYYYRVLGPSHAVRVNGQLVRHARGSVFSCDNPRMHEIFKGILMQVDGPDTVTPPVAPNSVLVRPPETETPSTEKEEETTTTAEEDDDVTSEFELAIEAGLTVKKAGKRKKKQLYDIIENGEKINEDPLSLEEANALLQDFVSK